jgi:Ni/Co efflux regulator RcnB
MDRKQFLTGLVAVCATAAQTAAAGDLTIDVRFSKDEISIIRAYYERASRSGRPERRSGRQLPPGIAKNLARGKALPPGIAKQALPVDLLAKLPPAPRGYDRIIVDGKVLLIEAATQIVHDILTDIVLK